MAIYGPNSLKEPDRQVRVVQKFFSECFFLGLEEEKSVSHISVVRTLIPIPSFSPRAFNALQSLLSMILEQFEDRLVQILLAVAVLSGVLSAFEDDPHVSESVSCTSATDARSGGLGVFVLALADLMLVDAKSVHADAPVFELVYVTGSR